MTLEEQVKIVKDALADKKAVDVKAYDVRGISGFADAFVVATGTAAPHLKALVAGTQAAMKEHGVNSYRTSGDPRLDCGRLRRCGRPCVLARGARLLRAREALGDRPAPLNDCAQIRRFVV